MKHSLLINLKEKGFYSVFYKEQWQRPPLFYNVHYLLKKKDFCRQHEQDNILNGSTFTLVHFHIGILILYSILNNNIYLVACNTNNTYKALAHSSLGSHPLLPWVQLSGLCISCWIWKIKRNLDLSNRRRKKIKVVHYLIWYETKQSK